MMNKKNITDLIILVKQNLEQQEQDLIELFKQFDADYINGDILIFNGNLFPELLHYNLPKQMMVSCWLSDDCLGYKITKDFFNVLYKPVDISIGRNTSWETKLNYWIC